MIVVLHALPVDQRAVAAVQITQCPLALRLKNFGVVTTAPLVLDDDRVRRCPANRHRFAVHEAAAEAGPYRRYRDVLATALQGVCSEVGIDPRADEIEAFSGSVGDWPAFPDTPAALVALRDRFRLGIITNCDDDLFAASQPRLGVPFDWVVTAEQVGAYKPSERSFEVAFERLGIPRERILHVAQSLFHDHAPARRLGLATVWIDRRQGRTGGGATPPSVSRSSCVRHPR